MMFTRCIFYKAIWKSIISKMCHSIGVTIGLIRTGRHAKKMSWVCQLFVSGFAFWCTGSTSILVVSFHSLKFSIKLMNYSCYRSQFFLHHWTQSFHFYTLNPVSCLHNSWLTRIFESCHDTHDKISTAIMPYKFLEHVMDMKMVL